MPSALLRLRHRCTCAPRRAPMAGRSLSSRWPLCELGAPPVPASAASGASILHLPPYRPDLNPIGQPFAKLWALLRRAAARTKDELWSTIGRLLQTCRPTECANDLPHSG